MLVVFLGACLCQILKEINSWRIFFPNSDTRRSDTSDTAFDQGIKAQFATLGYATYGTKPQPGQSSESDQVIKSFHSVWKLVSPFETDFAKRKVVEEFLYLVILQS